MPRKLTICLTATFLMLFLVDQKSIAKETLTEAQQKMALYLKTEAITNIPWFYIAAVDQYERSVRSARRDIPDSKGLSGIYYQPKEWVGLLNPNMTDTNPIRIASFGGIGLDGNDDGLINRDDPEDVLYTMAHYLQSYGPDEDSIKIALWDYYQRGKTVDLIMGFAKVYKAFNKINLSDHAFPVPLRMNYDYNSTWGARRGWGGLRIHEGTDIFAGYGTPVRATSYGTIETMGWNKFGGWRIGIRDLNSVYHYYAHMTGYNKGIVKGTVVHPGQVIGYVGSSGYGPKGTQGKFPPHLHYGMYRDNGITEYSFDPYPYLRSWERTERRQKKD